MRVLSKRHPNFTVNAQVIRICPDLKPICSFFENCLMEGNDGSCLCLSKEVLLSQHCTEGACKDPKVCNEFYLCWGVNLTSREKGKAVEMARTIGISHWFKNSSKSETRIPLQSTTKGQLDYDRSPDRFNCSCVRWGGSRNRSCLTPPPIAGIDDDEPKAPFAQYGTGPWNSRTRDATESEIQFKQYVFYSVTFVILLVLVGGMIFLILFLVSQKHKNEEIRSITREAEQKRAEISAASKLLEEQCEMEKAANRATLDLVKYGAPSNPTLPGCRLSACHPPRLETEFPQDGGGSNGAGGGRVQTLADYNRNMVMSGQQTGRTLAYKQKGFEVENLTNFDLEARNMDAEMAEGGTEESAQQFVPPHLRNLNFPTMRRDEKSLYYYSTTQGSDYGQTQ